MSFTTQETGSLDDMLRQCKRDPRYIGGRDNQSKTPLIHAAEQGRKDMVRYIVGQEVGADIINHRDRQGFTALYHACREGHPEIVSLLLNAGADASLGSDSSGCSPLMTAAENGMIGIVEKLLTHHTPPDLDVVDYCGNTALSNACSWDHPDVAMLLLEAGADPSVPDRYGQTATDVSTDVANDRCIAVLEVWKRAYFMYKAQRLRDAHDLLSAPRPPNDDATAHTGIHTRTRTEAHLQPGGCMNYLKKRIEQGDPLPEVQVRVRSFKKRWGKSATGKERLWWEVVEYVVCRLRGEWMVELLDAMSGVEKKKGDKVDVGGSEYVEDSAGKGDGGGAKGAEKGRGSEGDSMDDYESNVTTIGGNGYY